MRNHGLRWLAIATGFLFSHLAIAQAPGNDASYYGEVIISVTGVKKTTKAPVPLVAEIFVNDRYVGQTPYRDGFPRGNYMIRLEANGNAMTYPIQVIPGSVHEVNGQLLVPLTNEERLENQRKRDEEAKLRRSAEIKQWQLAYDDWKTANDKVQLRRKPYMITAGILLPTGLGLTIAGLVTLSKYKTQSDDYDSAEAEFNQLTNPIDIREYRTYLRDTESSMKKNKVMTAVFLPVGLTAALTSLAMFVLAPARPREPAVPKHLEGFIRISASGFVAPGMGAIRIVGTF
jgi:hypothetical protein